MKKVKALYFGQKVEVPTWARWMALDANCSLFCYDERPKNDLMPDVWAVQKGQLRCVIPYWDEAPEVNWEDSLSELDNFQEDDEKMGAIKIGGESLSEIKYAEDSELATYLISRGIPCIKGGNDVPEFQEYRSESYREAAMEFVATENCPVGINYYITSENASDIGANQYAAFQVDACDEISYGRLS